MPDNPEKMPENPEIRKALDTIMGHEITDEELQTFAFIVKVASWDETNLPGQGFVTSRNILINQKFCQQPPLLDVSATRSTDANGRSKFLLTDFICSKGLTFEAPINVVATPVARIPVFVTVLQSLVVIPGGVLATDVLIQVFSWDANGAPAPNITFNWRCRVPFEEPGPV